MRKQKKFVSKKLFVRKTIAALTTSLVLFAAPGQLWAAVSPGPDYVVDTNAPNPVTTKVGSGRAESNGSVVVNNGAVIDVYNNSAISLGDSVRIYVNGTVQNYATNNYGDYGTGANTIEVNGNSIIHVSGTGLVYSQGTQNNAEAINVHGYSNQIIIDPGGVVKADHAAALWFQDQNAWQPGDQRNVVDNSGTIQGTSETAPVFGSQGQQQGGIVFYNRSTGSVIGSLYFGNGDDELHFYTGSLVTGNISGGAGNNALYLNGGNPGDILRGDISDFSTLTKNDDGIWEIAGTIVGYTDVTVNDGVLALTGNNTGFAGKLVVNGGTLQAQTRSLPTNNPNTGNTQNVILDGGDIFINQDYDSTYKGQIVRLNQASTGALYKAGAGVVTLAPEAGENTYNGITVIQGGGLAIADEKALGYGGILLNGGALVASNNLTLADPARGNILIGNPAGTSGTINTQGYTVTVNKGLGLGIGDQGYTLNKTGSGILVLNANNLFQGTTNVLAGTLRVMSNDATNLTGDLYVYQNARLEGTGSLGSVGRQVFNSGTIEPGTFENQFGTLTLRSNYTGQPGGALDINTVLGDDNSQTSRLVIEGSTGYIPTSIRVINHNGPGAITQEGIRIVEVGGTSDANAFTLRYDYQHTDGRTAVVGGKYLYTLEQGSKSNPNDGNWYLKTLTEPDPNNPGGMIPDPNNPGGVIPDPNNPGQVIPDPNNPGGMIPDPNDSGNFKPVINPAVPIYEVYPQILLNYMRLGTLEERVGNRRWYVLDNADPNDAEVYNQQFNDGVWVRTEGSSGKFDARQSSISSASEYDIDMWRVQVGYDKIFDKKEDGSFFTGGLNFSLGKADADIKSNIGRGKIKSKATSLGATATWYNANGFYIDGQAQATWFDSDLTSKTLVTPGQKNGNDGFGYTVGIEAGRRIQLRNPNLSLTPQIQIAYANADFDNFTDTHGVRVKNDSADSIWSRLGLALNYEKTDPNGNHRKLYGLLDFYHDFDNKSKIEMFGEKYKYKNEATWVGFSIGGSYNYGTNNKYSLYGELGIRTSVKNFGDSHVLRGEIGFRYHF